MMNILASDRGLHKQKYYKKKNVHEYLVELIPTVSTQNFFSCIFCKLEKAV